MQIGVIGLGIMGAPMAKNIIQKSTHTVHLLDLNKTAVQKLVSIGGVEAASVADIAAKCDVIITMLPTGKHVKDVLISASGYIQFAKAGAIVIDMSSIAPEEATIVGQALATKGISYLDAPVSGGEPMAISGDLSIMVGGDDESFNKVSPLLQLMGTKIVHVGPIGTGSATKLANQILVSVHLAALSEAVVFAKKSGIDLNKFYEAVHSGLAGSAVLEAKLPKIIQNDFEPGGKIETNYKDLCNIEAAANKLLVPLPVTSLVKEAFKSQMANGQAHKDHSSVLHYFEKIANTSEVLT